MLFAIGLVASFLGTLAGGAGLLTLPTLLMLGLPIQSAIGINKFCGFVSSLSGIPFVLKHKDMTIRELMLTAFIGLIGGVLGAVITSHLSADTMNVVAFVLLLFAFLITIRKQSISPSSKQLKHKPLADSFTNAFTAVYDGAFGPGSATLIIMYWIKVGKTYMEAIQRSRMLILGSGFGSFLVFERTGHIDWDWALAMGGAYVLGTQLALAVLPRIQQKLAKAFLLTITGVLLVQIGWELLNSNK